MDFYYIIFFMSKSFTIKVILILKEVNGKCRKVGTILPNEYNLSTLLKLAEGNEWLYEDVPCVSEKAIYAESDSFSKFEKKKHIKAE